MVSAENKNGLRLHVVIGDSQRRFSCSNAGDASEVCAANAADKVAEINLLCFVGNALSE